MVLVLVLVFVLVLVGVGVGLGISHGHTILGKYDLAVSSVAYSVLHYPFLLFLSVSLSISLTFGLSPIKQP